MRLSCSAEETPNVMFPSAEVDLCGRCYRPWDWSWKKLYPNARTLCMDMAQDEDLESKFEATCVIAEDMGQRPWNPEEIKLTRRVGFNLVHNFRVVNDKDLEDLNILPKGISASDCGHKHSTVKMGPAYGVKGTIVQHDTKPFVEVQRIDSIFVDQQEIIMPASRMLQQKQGETVMKDEISKLEKGLPVGIRGHAAPPTMAMIESAAKVFLQNKSGGRARHVAGESADEKGGEEDDEGEEEEEMEIDEPVEPDAIQPYDGASDGQQGLRHSRHSRSMPDGRDCEPSPVRPSPPTQLRTPLKGSHGGDALRRGRSPGDLEETPATSDDERRLHRSKSRGNLSCPRASPRSSANRCPSPAASKAASVVSSGRRGRPVTRSKDDDMGRIRAFEDECTIASILDGCPVGDRVYALSRFKPTLEAAASRKRVLQERLKAAQSLTSEKLKEMDRTTRTKVMQALGKGVDYSACPKWCTSLLGVALKEQSDPELLWDMIVPVCSDTRKEFNPTSPKLSAIVGPSDCKKELDARDHFLNFILLPTMKKTTEGLPTLASLQGTIADCMRSHGDGTGEAQRSGFLHDALVAVTTLLVIADHSAGSIGDCKVDRKELRLMLTGEYSKDWSPLQATADEIPFWSENKAEWRRAAQVDMTEGPKIKAMEQRLQSAACQPIDLLMCLEALPRWLSQCRSGTCAKLVAYLLDGCAKLLGELEEGLDTASAKPAEEFRELEGFIRLAAQALTQSSSKQLYTKHNDSIVSLRTRVQKALAQTTRNAKENGILTSLQSFQRGGETVRVREAYSQSVGLNFGDENHIAIIVDGCESIASDKLMGVTFDKAGAMDSQQIAPALDNTNLVINVLRLCSEEKMGEKGTELNARMQHLATILAVMEELFHLQGLGSSAEQIAHADGPHHYSSLMDLLGIVDCHRHQVEVSNALPMLVRTISELDTVFGFGLGEARAATSAFERADFGATAADLTDVIGALAEISQGATDGKSWKENLAADAEWSEVLAEAVPTLFAKRGLCSKIQKQLDTANDLLRTLGEMGEKYSLQSEYTEHKSKLASVEKECNITIVESGLLQILKDKAKDTATKVIDLQSVLDTLPERELGAADIHETIYGEAMNTLKM